MENMTEESAGKPLSNTVSGTPETENHLETVAESADSAVRSARNKGKCERHLLIMDSYAFLLTDLVFARQRYSIKYVGTDVNRFEVFAVCSGNAS
ncbi:hypothetical protein Tco_0772822 [Tanacetum coccineum]|uniref:Uncharacterized protein n=1 Tax=Tanacetum coccineum TaxID=301880 RepID=A0ABQ4ZKB4_9ASTR